MEVYQEASAADFLQKNETLLLSRESENNLILGLAARLQKNQRSTENPLFFTITDQGRILGQAMRTSAHHPLILAHMPQTAIESLAKYLKQHQVTLHSLQGPNQVLESFLKFWDLPSRLAMHQGIYQLDRVIAPDYESGSMRLASMNDLALVEHYSLGFIQDCFPEEKDILAQAKEAANRHISSQMIYLWQNRVGEVVAMSANHRQSQNAATIGWVYTPPEHRRHGYASKLVAAQSQYLLDQGKQFCNLFTDLLNPTSNAIYQKIGYRKIGENKHYSFL